MPSLSKSRGGQKPRINPLTQSFAVAAVFAGVLGITILGAVSNHLRGNIRPPVTTPGQKPPPFGGRQPTQEQSNAAAEQVRQIAQFQAKEQILKRKYNISSGNLRANDSAKLRQEVVSWAVNEAYRRVLRTYRKPGDYMLVATEKVKQEASQGFAKGVKAGVDELSRRNIMNALSSKAPQSGKH